MDIFLSYHDLFSDWPLALRQAHILIRMSRTSKYFEMADHFARLWAKPLGVNGGVEFLSGSNMAALDELFEQAPSKGELNHLFETFQHCINLKEASAYAELFTQKQPKNIEEAIALHIALLTTKGHQYLASVEEVTAQSWLGLWQEKMHQQNRQQLEHSAICLAPERSCPEPTQNFDEAIERYLEKFGETSGLAVAVVGALPFSSYIGLNLLSAISGPLSHMSSLFRLAQDVHVDLDEVLNASIYAVAAEHQLSFGAAREYLKSGMISPIDLEQKLKKLWEVHYARASLQCEGSLYPYRDSQLGNSLKHFYSALFEVAQMLTGRWKS